MCTFFRNNPGPLIQKTFFLSWNQMKKIFLNIIDDAIVENIYL